MYFNEPTVSGKACGRWGVWIYRLGADYRRALGNFSDRNFFRLQSGIVVRFGGG